MSSREEKVRVQLEINRDLYRKNDSVMTSVTNYDGIPNEDQIRMQLNIAMRLNIDGYSKGALKNPDVFNELNARCAQELLKRIDAVETSLFEETEEI